MQTNEEASKGLQTEEMEYEEDLNWDKKPNDNKIIADFIQRFGLEYTKDSGGERYNPRKHSHTTVGTEQRGFYVYYGFPNGTTKPVASFWAMSDDQRFRLIHIDLGRVMEQVIKYYENRGFSVPPKREKTNN